MGKDKNLLSEEHLRKIMHRSGYKINESPRYRSLVNDGEEFDTIPDENIGNRVGLGGNFNTMVSEVGEQEDAEQEGTEPREPTNAPEPETAPEGDEMPEPPAPDYAEDDMPPEAGAPEAAMGGPVQPEVDEIQNDIIRHNIEAMKSIQSELQNLNNTVTGLNAKLGELNAEVEEVREPTNMEKLMKKTDVSYPYYFNLNDFWKDNWFTQKRDEAQEKGVRELPDGTYVADFDDLPKPSKTDIQNSFNNIV